MKLLLQKGNKRKNYKSYKSINNRREVEVDMEKCKKRNTEHCTKSKFCAIRDRSKIIEPLLESYPQVLVTTSLNGFTSYLLAIV